jgi:hypothetical protein
MKNSKNSRRDFVKNTAALGLGIISTPKTFFINKGIENDDQIIGHGDFRYKIEKEWGINAQYPVNDCHEMVLDNDKNLYLTTNHNQNNILKYNRSGKIIDSWSIGNEGTHGLTINDEGGEEFLYITDYAEHKVYKTDTKGKILLQIEWPEFIPEYTSDKEFKPTETAIADNGDIYVCDGYGLDFIIQYNSKGEYIHHFGGRGDSDSTFNCCHGITIDNRDNTPSLLITSRTNNEFKRFSMGGLFIEKFELPGCWICRPVLDGNELYFAVIITNSWDKFDGMLGILDQNNKVVSLPGGSIPKYSENNFLAPLSDKKSFLNPHDICIDEDKNLYIPQWNSKNTYPIKLTRI